MFYRIIIWKNKDKYYFKKLKGYYCEYYVGYKNQYEHEVILIIDVSEFQKDKSTIKRRVVNRLIKLLQKV